MNWSKEKEEHIQSPDENPGLPLCIWDSKQAEMWRHSPRVFREGWNRYAQESADFFSKRMGRSTNVYHEWKPVLSFEQWLMMQKQLG